MGKPPYYHDVDALITGITVVRPYGEASPLTTLGITDHVPLQWIRSSAKGPVTAWRVDNLNGMNFVVAHRPGVKHDTSDAMSRYLFLGPKTYMSGSRECNMPAPSTFIFLFKKY